MERPWSIPKENKVTKGELLAWCANYQNYHYYNHNSQVAINPYLRFQIAVYQIYQGMNWVDTPSEWESLAAGGIHFLGAAEGMGLKSHYPEFSNKWRFRYPYERDWKQVLYHVSKAQQHILYMQLGSKTKRSASRVNKEELGKSLGILAERMFSYIPSFQLYEGIELATTTMCEHL